MRLEKGLRLTIVVAALTLLCTSGVLAAEQRLTILHTNDHHGHFEKFAPYPVKDVGGLAAQSTLVNIVRAEVEKDGGQVLVLSAGDINTGVPESDLLDGEPDIQLMNMIGYDAMTLGNHEFDNPPDVLTKQRQWAKFPFLAANVLVKKSGEPLVAPYVIKEVGGLKVAILGLVTNEVPTLVLPENVTELEFADPIATAARYVPQLRREADLVVALTHLGLYREETDRRGDVQLAKAVPGIDVIVGGHTHTELDEPVRIGDTIIVQAGGYSEQVGRLDLVVDSATDKVTASSWTALPVNGKERIKYQDASYYRYVGIGYIEDEQILQAMAPYLANASELLAKVIGTTEVELVGGKSVSRSQETNLGNLITDGMRWKTGADIAFLNGGGIRAGIAPGSITYRDVLTVQPFGNTLTELKLTGTQVMAVLDKAATNVGSGGFLHVAGLTVAYNITTGKAEATLADGSAMVPEKVYSVVTNNFVAAGGDGYAMLKEQPAYDTGYVDADVTMSYISLQGKVQPVLEGRISVLQ